jgi:transposase
MPNKPLKISEEQEEDIREKVKTQFMTDIAKEYNVSISIIHKVVHNTYRIKSQKPEVLFGTRNLSE